VALLLLRLVVSVWALGQGMIGLAHLSTWMSFASAALLIPCGVCVLIGLFTPIANVVVALVVFLISISWIVLPASKLMECKPASFEIIAISLSIAMLGPGLFSVDARLFGRREIVIPPTSRPKQP
jgi:uncharacterized membrane protein YphA (DoxX/SURF4 family)